MIKNIGAGVVLALLGVSAAQAQTAPTPLTASRPMTGSDCGLRLSIPLTNTAAIILTQPASTAELPLGCRVTVSNLGTGLFTLAQGSSGETLGSFDFSSQKPVTGNVILAGQFASGVFWQEFSGAASFNIGD